MNAEIRDTRIDVLMALLKKGEENAVDRDMLASLLGMGDRATRELIEKARNEGNLILNKQNGKGYFLPGSIDDVKRQYIQDTNRAMAILKRRKHARKILKEAGVKV